jgi:hypothetical protein
MYKNYSSFGDEVADDGSTELEIEHLVQKNEEEFPLAISKYQKSDQVIKYLFFLCTVVLFVGLLLLEFTEVTRYFRNQNV